MVWFMVLWPVVVFLTSQQSLECSGRTNNKIPDAAESTTQPMNSGRSVPFFSKSLSTQSAAG